jgi:hypothetical protein
MNSAQTTFRLSPIRYHAPHFPTRDVILSQPACPQSIDIESFNIYALGAGWLGQNHIPCGKVGSVISNGREPKSCLG